MKQGTLSITSMKQATRSAVVRGSTAAAVMGMFAFAAFSGQMAPLTAHASAALDYHTGYSVQGDWLCYGWSDGSYHCTQQWYTSGGRYISNNSSWVPSEGGATSAPVSAPVNAPVAYISNTGGGGNTAGYPWGQCTYGAAALSWDNVSGLGNAMDWFANAQARGMATSYSPRVGATAVFQPGVQGAGGLGHVAHVTAVYGDGSYEVEEMDYYGYGGGFGIFSYRHAYSGAGVAFIY